ncbi:hypothetical protein E143388_07384 [Rhodococcus opacus]|nr:hypothetical protein E143388_07384 [Rhodococcus opacus]
MTLRLPTTLATDSDAAAVAALNRCYGRPSYLGDDAYVGAHFASQARSPVLDQEVTTRERAANFAGRHSKRVVGLLLRLRAVGPAVALW